MLLERVLGLVGELLGVLRAVRELVQLVRLVGMDIASATIRCTSSSEARAALDQDLLLVAGAEVARRDVDDPVRVDGEADLDLWRARIAGGIPTSWNLPRVLL